MTTRVLTPWVLFDRWSATAPAVRVRERLTVSSALAIGLDVVIAGYLLALALIAVTGGIRYGSISLRDPAKPILVLILLMPVRVGLAERDWWGRWIATRVRGAWDALSRARPDVADVAFALTMTSVATVGVGYLANVIFAPAYVRVYAMPFAQPKLAEIFAAWDSGWYFDIARHGYYFNAGGQSSVAFFPLYPMLMRMAAWPFGGGDRAVWIAGVVVSCAAFAASLLVLHRLTVAVFGDRQAARRTVLYVALFPFAVFFTRVYTESLFLLLTLLAIRAASRGRWWPAAIWGALATLTRPNGILIGLPLVLLALQGRPSPRDLVRRVAPLAGLPLALGAYCAYVYTLAGDPLAWLHAQQHWGYSLGHPPWRLLQNLVAKLVKYGPFDYFVLSKKTPFEFFHGMTAIAVLALTPSVFRRLGVAMGAYVLASMLVPLSSNALEGIGRYAAVLFPVFMVVGGTTSARAHEAIVAVGALFLALVTALFVTVRPIY